MAPQYSFASSSAAPATSKPQRRGMFGRYGRNRTQSEDNSDAGSLTYSAASSVQSARSGSAAGESTDSSFADIMRVLDLQDTQQLKDFIAKEGVAKTDELYRKRGGSSSVSVASSLQYSTDGESHLEGTKLLQTIGAGQPSDSFAFDGGSGSDIGVGGNDDKLDLLFAPAAPAVVKKTKGNKVVLGKDRNTTNTTDGYGHNHGGMSTPRSNRSGRKKQFDIMSNITGSGQQQQHQHQRQQYQQYRSGSPSYSAASPSSTRSTPTKSPPPSTPMTAPGTPPLPNKRRSSSFYYLEGDNDEDDPFYKEWWMACFADALQGAKNLSDTTLQGAKNLSDTMFKKE
eukprot:CAMPEP_0113493624 /NCGR_PEP_ID=MMETSP0014_2-20120614/28686_1 /TAXON_ID=2857 /ORGANISM="Nitzschia sp." /LENGTH=340 /DNA_ID=CAMNT_0000387489 /DNA_START=431 /DNA_END=1453 /DNA_ORIENTATION=+ /assembly_acc=CAM_ASM_000159